MADDRMAVLETVRKAISEGDADFLREGVRDPDARRRSRSSRGCRAASATRTRG